MSQKLEAPDFLIYQRERSLLEKWFEQVRPIIIDAQNLKSTEEISIKIAPISGELKNRFRVQSSNDRMYYAVTKGIEDLKFAEPTIENLLGPFAVANRRPLAVLIFAQTSQFDLNIPLIVVPNPESKWLTDGDLVIVREGVDARRGSELMILTPLSPDLQGSDEHPFHLSAKNFSGTRTTVLTKGETSWGKIGGLVVGIGNF